MPLQCGLSQLTMCLGIWISVQAHVHGIIAATGSTRSRSGVGKLLLFAYQNQLKYFAKLLNLPTKIYIVMLFDVFK